MADQVRRRLACDRCHAQKLRCPKRKGNESCDRCIKGRRQCIFSPSLRPVWPQAGPTGVISSDTSLGENLAASRPEKRKRRPCHQEATVKATVDNEEADEISFHVEQQPLEDMLLQWNHPPGLTPNPSPPLDTHDNPFSNMNVDSASTEHFIQTTIGQMLAPANTSASTPQNTLLPDLFSPTNFENLETQFYGESRPEMISCLDPAIVSRSIEGTFLDTNGLSTTATSAPATPLNFQKPRYNINTTCVQQLATLSSKLYQHRKTIPTLTMFEDIGGGLTEASKKRVAAGYNLDETYELTQRLIELYPTFLSASFPVESSHSASLSANEEQIQLSSMIEKSHQSLDKRKVQPSSGSFNSFNPPVDVASVFLMLSCQHRVLDIWEAIQCLMHGCIEHSTVSNQHDDVIMTVGVLRIGSFVPPTAAATPMHLSLLNYIFEQLFESIRGLLSKLIAVTGTKACGGFPESISGQQGHRQNPRKQGADIDAVILATKATVDRTSSLANEFENLKGQILQLSRKSQ